MSEQDVTPTPLPAEEHRGGDKPDWQHALPGQELPEIPVTAPATEVTIAPDYDEPRDAE